MRAFVLLPLAMAVCACGESEAPTAIEDPSKLSAELEAEARKIEERAAIAVREAETLAERELQELRAEASAARAAAQADEPATEQEPADK